VEKDEEGKGKKEGEEKKDSLKGPKGELGRC
jgi:hypothetical protein